MLDKGQEADWFQSHFIVVLFVLSAVGLLLTAAASLAQTIGTADTTAALKALLPGQYQLVSKLGLNTPRDIPQPLLYRWSGTACAADELCVMGSCKGYIFVSASWECGNGNAFPVYCQSRGICVGQGVACP